MANKTTPKKSPMHLSNKIWFIFAIASGLMAAALMLTILNSMISTPPEANKYRAMAEKVVENIETVKAKSGGANEITIIDDKEKQKITVVNGKNKIEIDKIVNDMDFELIEDKGTYMLLGTGVNPSSNISYSSNTATYNYAQ